MVPKNTVVVSIRSIFHKPDNIKYFRLLLLPWSPVGWGILHDELTAM